MRFSDRYQLLSLFAIPIFVGFSCTSDNQFQPELGWFPSSVGNYWSEKNPCSKPEYRWEVIESSKTDTADFFLIKRSLNPCQQPGSHIYTWYAFALIEQKLYFSNENLEYVGLHSDLSLDLGESFINSAMNIRYTLVEKSDNMMSYEYDLYKDRTHLLTFIKGMGIDEGWDEVFVEGKLIKR